MHRLPNILSFSRIILAPVFLWMYLQDDLVLRSLSIAVFVVAALTDFADGFVARRMRYESRFGVFLDPLADKLLTFAGFVCLPFVDRELYPWWAVAVIVVRDSAVTGLRVHAQQKGIQVQTRYSAKVKTFVQMVFLYVALILGVAVESSNPILIYSGAIMSSWAMYGFMMAVVALTVYSGLEYLVVNRGIWSRAESHGRES